MAEAVTTDTLVSHTDDRGRTLSGMGADAEQLAETMERHAPPAKPDAPAADPAAQQPPASTEPTAPVSRGRQRFSDLTKERDEAKAAAEAEKRARETLARERDELRQRLEARQPEPPKAAEPTAAPTHTRPEPTEDEIGAKYKTYAEFTRDLATWVFEQQAAASSKSYEQQVRDVLARERSREQFQSTIETSQERARKAYPDFDALLNGPAGTIPMARDEKEAVDRVAFIAKHPQSEHIQYQILKNPALAEQLRDSDAYTFGVTVAGLVPKEQPKQTWTPPPPPHPTVGASSPTTAVSSAELSKKGYDFDASGYREKRAAERGVKTRRF